jgi:hypothetical protein
LCTSVNAIYGNAAISLIDRLEPPETIHQNLTKFGDETGGMLRRSGHLNPSFSPGNQTNRSLVMKETQVELQVSGNSKQVASQNGRGFQEQMVMRFRPQHESSGYTKSDNQQVSQR